MRKHDLPRHEEICKTPTYVAIRAARLDRGPKSYASLVIGTLGQSAILMFAAVSGGGTPWARRDAAASDPRGRQSDQLGPEIAFTIAAEIFAKENGLEVISTRAQRCARQMRRYRQRGTDPQAPRASPDRCQIICIVDISTSPL